MSVAAIGILYGVSVLVALGVISGLKGWDEPWPLAAPVWPLVLVVIGMHIVTRHICDGMEERQQRIENDRLVEERLLREVGLDL